MQAFLGALAVLGGLAAATFQIWLLLRAPRRSFLLGYAAWTPVAVLGLAAATWDQGPAAAVSTALLIGLPAYPFVWAAFWARSYNAVDVAATAHARQLERLRYRPTDFGGVAAPGPAATSATGVPIVAAAPPPDPLTSRFTVSPTAPALDRVVNPRRSAAAVAGEAVVLVVVGAAFVTILLWHLLADIRPSPAYRREAVIATLEDAGYQGVHADEDGAVACEGWTYGYRWTAVGVDGHACVSRYGESVSGWVTRRWVPDAPYARGAAAR